MYKTGQWQNIVHPIIYPSSGDKIHWTHLSPSPYALMTFISILVSSQLPPLLVILKEHNYMSLFIPSRLQHHYVQNLLNNSRGQLEAGHQIKALLVVFQSPLTGKDGPSFQIIYFPQTSSKVKLKRLRILITI